MASLIILLLLVSSNIPTHAQNYVDNFSQWNKKRPIRAKTLYVVLHTTEGGDKSSLNCVKAEGTCNYLITTNGLIHRIISRTKLAKHAGRSMWYGHTNLSDCSIGVEIVGTHNKKPSDKQIQAIKKLVTDLKKIYGTKDINFLAHSMVAYGSPNKYFHYNHRGRKRCAMLFATKEIRKQIGLSNIFISDPDVEAKRLKVADPYLASILYGKQQLPKEEKPSVKGITDPNSTNDEAFEGFREVGNTGIFSIAGNEYNSQNTLYFFPDGRIRSGAELSKTELNMLPKGTKVLLGYVYGGKISKSRTAYQVLGKRWNYSSTFYRFPDKSIKTGDEVNGNELPANTIVLYRQ